MLTFLLYLVTLCVSVPVYLSASFVLYLSACLPVHLTDCLFSCPSVSLSSSIHSFMGVLGGKFRLTLLGERMGPRPVGATKIQLQPQGSSMASCMCPLQVAQFCFHLQKDKDGPPDCMPHCKPGGRRSWLCYPNAMQCCLEPRL